MRKLLIILLVIVLLFAGFMTYKTVAAQKAAAAAQAELEEYRQKAEEEAAAAAAAQAEQAQAESPKIELDFEKLYALHNSDDIVMKVNGGDVSWGEYFYCIYAQAGKIMNTMSQLAMYYGISPTWDDPMDEEGSETVADLAMSNSVEMLKQQMAIQSYAEENGVVLSEEDEAKLKEESDAYIAKLVGEDAGEEDIDAALAKLFISHDRFDEINRISALYDKGFAERFGENGSKVSDADAIGYLEDNDYMAATHILFLTVDMATGEALSDEAKAEKKARAEELLSQLRAIEDRDELIKTFSELKEQYCEDTGKTMYPDGYVFTPGTMVAEFENAILAMNEYELSDIVESGYGYHIIMRTALDPDMELDMSGAGKSATGRSLFAEKEYAKDMQTMMDNTSVEYVNGYEPPRLGEFVKE